VVSPSPDGTEGRCIDNKSTRTRVLPLKTSCKILIDKVFQI
jgi:hypothetical protein